MKKDVIWVVEVFDEISFSWKTTVGIGLSRSEGRLTLCEWEKRNPHDDFRLKQYERIGE